MIMGHWEFGREVFYDFDEMYEYWVDNGYHPSYDLHRWLDDNYSASDIYVKFLESEFTESAMLELVDEYYDSVRDQAEEECEPGEDLDINGEIFTWVEDDDASYNRKSQARKNSPRNTTTKKTVKKAPTKKTPAKKPTVKKGRR